MPTCCQTSNESSARIEVTELTNASALLSVPIKTRRCRLLRDFQFGLFLSFMISVGVLMERRNRALGIALGLVLNVGALGCMSPSKGETLNLAGNWVGTADSDPLVATITQSGSTHSQTIGGTIGSPGISCGLSGSIEGSKLTLSISCPAGTFTAFGSATCSMNASETFVVSATSIKKIFMQNWSPSCIPAVSSSASNFVQITLTKQ